MANDSESAVKILISFGLDPGKADEAVGLINKIKQEGQNMGMPEGWQGMEKYKHVLTEASHEAHGLHGHVRELNLLMRQGGPIASEFGHLLHLAFNPALLGGAALAGGLELYFHWQEKVAERHKEAIRDLERINEETRKLIAAGPTIYQNWFETLKVVADAKAEYESLSESLKVAEGNAKRFNETALAGLDARNEKIARGNGLLEAQVGLMQAAGMIDSQEAERAKNALKEKGEIEKINVEVQKAAAQLSQAQATAEQESYKIGGAGAHLSRSRAGGVTNYSYPEQAMAADLAAANQKVQDAKEDVRRNQEIKIAPINKQIAEQEEIIATQQKRMRDHPMEWNDATAVILEAKKTKQELEDRKKAGVEAEPQLVQALADAEKALSDLKTVPAKIEALNATINDAKNKADIAASAAPSKISDIRQKTALENVTALVKGGENINQIYERGVDAQAILARTSKAQRDQIEQAAAKADADKISGHFSERDQQAIAAREQLHKYLQQFDDMKDLFTGMGDNADAVTALIQRAITHSGNVNTQLSQLAVQMSEIEATLGNIGPSTR